MRTMPSSSRSFSSLFFLIIAALGASGGLAACSDDASGDADAGADAAPDADTDSDTDTDTDADTDSDTDADTDSDADADTDSDTDADADSDTDADADTDTDTDAGVDAGTDGGADGGGEVPECWEDDDCGTTTECIAYTCLEGSCAEPIPSAPSTPCNDIGVCDSSGHCIECSEDDDCGTTTECVSYTCADGTCEGPDLVYENTPCSENGGRVCDGDGSCVECNLDFDCDAMASACVAAVCSEHACTTYDADPGIGCSENGGVVCDGHGSCVECVYETDCPGTGNPCTAYTCSISGSCEFGNVPEGDPCDAFGGVVCDGAGNCVECNYDEDCASLNCLPGGHCGPPEP